MHIDLNSCFATVEQQANPLLRGKPIAVAAYASSNGCILAASIEAKTYGIKTGMRVKDGKFLYPDLIVLSPDPWKYRVVHLRLRKIFQKYTNHFAPKSIDEFVLHFTDKDSHLSGNNLMELGEELRNRIYKDVGDWLHVSIGVAPNRFLAKTASGMKKPCGLVEINKDNHLEKFAELKLTDLCGIARQNEIRLNIMGINSVMDLYQSPIWKAKAAFQSIAGYYWYTRLRGYEIDDVSFARRSYGNSYSLPKPFQEPYELAPILAKLVEKMSFRLRRAGYGATGVHLAIRYRDHRFWHKGQSLPRIIFDSREIYKEMYRLMLESPVKSPVANLAVTCFGLEKLQQLQLNLFEDVVKKQKLTEHLDDVNHRWGDFVVTTARMVETSQYIPDRIAFGNVKELEEFTNQSWYQR